MALQLDFLSCILVCTKSGVNDFGVVSRHSDHDSGVSAPALWLQTSRRRPWPTKFSSTGRGIRWKLHTLIDQTTFLKFEFSSEQIFVQHSACVCAIDEDIGLSYRLGDEGKSGMFELRSSFLGDSLTTSLCQRVLRVIRIEKILVINLLNLI